LNEREGRALERNEKGGRMQGWMYVHSVGTKMTRLLRHYEIQGKWNEEEYATCTNIMDPKGKPRLET
jgi:hypothetical protein